MPEHIFIAAIVTHGRKDYLVRWKFGWQVNNICLRAGREYKTVLSNIFVVVDIFVLNVVFINLSI